MQTSRTMWSDGFGSYRLVEQIGRGSAGTVFVGEYGSLRRPIAIKVLHEHLVADGSAERMLAEARALSVLDHPGIVKVLDCGMTPDGRAYIVMEYLAGELLHQRLRRGPLTEERVVMFARQLASALEVAHAAGIIHRDVKPENAFVIPDPDVPGGERIKLLDFGIAKCDDQERTATGVVLGTPAYMAPEQFGESRRVDHRVDIYALGVVMYAMATGTLPFVGSNTDELLAEHSFCLPRPASETGVSPGLSEIIDRCLAKQPHDRFASMAQLGAALRELELEGVSDWARSGIDDMIGVELDELDELDTATLSSNRVEGPGARARSHPSQHGPPLPTDLDIRIRVPWRSVLGALAAVAVALAYTLFEHGRAREAPLPPATLVEQDAVLSIARPAVEPRPIPAPRRSTPAEHRELAASREATAIDDKADQLRRDSTRARQTPVRREPVRREPVRVEASPAGARKVEVPSEAAGSEIHASPKEEEEDYASVTLPTLY